MLSARISAISTHLPAGVLDNHALAALSSDWTAEKIFEKTGVRERRIAAATETATDLAEAAARRLFQDWSVEPASIDFLLFCTETPDYLLPASACILQDRLGLATACGALDYNLGCSGFVYGLALAKGLIAAGAARRVLVLTADTYSKHIHPLDRSVRTLFGDGAAATLVDAVETDEDALGPFVFGTDGSGARNLMVPAGGARRPRSSETAIESTDPSGNVRSENHLYMDGAEVMTFTLRTVPAAVGQLLARSGLEMRDFDLFVLHQASALVLDRLRRKLAIPSERFVTAMELTGNTVSSSIPFALQPIVGSERTQSRRALLVGFGVGYSWAAASVLL